MKGDSLFIVNTPFLCLCMLEAIHHYNITDYDVVFKPDSVEANNQMVEGILNERGIRYSVVDMSQLSFILPHLFKRKKRYSKLFNGDYYGAGVAAYIYSIVYARCKARIVYFDDGTQTLELFCSQPKERVKTLKVRVFLRLFELLKHLKCLGKPYFYTIFDVNSKEFIIEKNTLSTLKTNNKVLERKGIYIIGTNIDGSYYDREDCLFVLKRLLERIQSVYDEEIWYCPHRRNRDDKELLQILDQYNIKLFNTKVSVEYDFVKNRINPTYIAGFNSTALYTLKLIYPDSIVENVFQRQVIEDPSVTAYAEAYSDQLQKIGVKTINLYDETVK